MGLVTAFALAGLAMKGWPVNAKAELVKQEQESPAVLLPNSPLAAPSQLRALSSTAQSISPIVSIAPTKQISASGYVVAPKSTALFAKYGGVVRRVNVELGDRVEAGQILAVLGDENAQFAAEQAQARLVSAKLALIAHDIELGQARTLFDRMATLANTNVVTALQVDEASSNLNAAQNAVAQGKQGVALAELAIRIAREPVDALNLRAPITGRITKLTATVGDTVLGQIDGQSLLTITNTDALFIDADVAETSIAMLRSGLQGEAVLDGFPDQPFAVELSRIAPEISAAKGTVGIRLTLDIPPTGIRPNMAARVQLFSAPTETN